MPPPKAYLERIQAVYPSLTVQTARLDTSGQNSVVLVVNDAVVFRFPRYALGVQGLAVEAAILRTVRRYVNLPTPDPVYAHLDAPPATAFIGYPRLPGEPLGRETLHSIAHDRVVRQVAHDLGRCLLALHAVPPAEVKTALPAYDGRAVWGDLYQRIRHRLWPAMQPDARVQVAAHFEAFLADDANFRPPPALVHNDFGASNILYDHRTQRVSGVIDFGSAGLGDPATDIAALGASYGDAFLAWVGEVYPLNAALLDRARFYQGTFALQESLFGAEMGDAEAYAAGMARYR